MKTNIKIIDGKKVLWLNHVVGYPLMVGENIESDLNYVLIECNSNMYDIATNILRYRVATPYGAYFRFELISAKQADAERIYIINAADKTIEVEEV